MPKFSRKRSNKKSLSKKRFLNRKKKLRNKTVKNRTIVPIGLGLPKQIVITQRYREAFSLASTTGTINSYQWSVNSLYDPNTTGVGHQPMYFDQLMALYQHYTVIGSRCKFRVTPINTSQPVTSIACYIDDNAVVTPTLVQNIAELSSAKMDIIPMGSGYVYTRVLKWSAKKAFGGTVLSNPDLQGTGSASPTEQQYFTVSFQATDLSTTTTVMIEVEIEYISVYQELKDIVSS